MAKTDFKTIDDYIGTFTEDVQLVLEELRQFIKEEAPGAQEVISYQIPAFKLNGKILIYFAGWKKHVSLYPITAEMTTAIKELSTYETSGKGTVRFSLGKPMPWPLIKKIVKYRMNENS